MIFSFTVFLRQIKPITKLLGRLLALHVRFHKFLTLKTNLHQYWERFGFKDTVGIKFFSRSKDFGTKDWLLLPFYTLFKLAVWAVYIAYYIVLLFVPILQIPNILGMDIFNVIIFFIWFYFLAEIQKRIEVDLLTEEINWDKVFKEKKEVKNQ
tara:strand:+ start:518 stop:976 length:459 start_codon:yes stop_codon:yes gene_type:complete